MGVTKQFMKIPTLFKQVKWGAETFKNTLLSIYNVQFRREKRIHLLTTLCRDYIRLHRCQHRRETLHYPHHSQGGRQCYTRTHKLNREVRGSEVRNKEYMWSRIDDDDLQYWCFLFFLSVFWFRILMFSFVFWGTPIVLWFWLQLSSSSHLFSLDELNIITFFFLFRHHMLQLEPYLSTFFL